MTRVLHVISGLQTGGAETMLAQLAGALQARGLPQHVVSMRGRGTHAERLEASNVPVASLEVTSLLNAPGGMLKLARLIAKLEPDIVQGWMYHGNIFAALAHRLVHGQARRALIWNLRASNMDAVRYGRILRLSARLSSWPSLIVANSETGAEFHVGQGFRPRRLCVIPNGVDTTRFRPDPSARAEVRHELEIPENAIVAIHVARVDPMKDHAMFLSAMERLPGLIALMVGRGTQRLSAPPNVRILGLRDDTARLYAASDIVVSTSAFGEGFSNVLSEGMSAGLVPVATDVGDARRIVGAAGHIVEPGNVADLVAAIAEEAALPREQLRRRGEDARARIVVNFALPKAVEAFAGLYEEACCIAAKARQSTPAPTDA